MPGFARAHAAVAAVGAVGLLMFAGRGEAVVRHDGLTRLDGPVALWVAAHRTVTQGQAGLLLARVTSPFVIVSLVLHYTNLGKSKYHRLDLPYVLEVAPLLTQRDMETAWKIAVERVPVAQWSGATRKGEAPAPS